MKRTISAIMALILMVCMTAALAGSGGTAADPLISKSYADSTYTDSVLEGGRKRIDEAFAETEAAAVARISAAGDNHTLLSGGPEGYEFAPGFTEISLPAGSSVSLVMGGSFVLVSGSASLTLTSGEVINVSSGSPVSGGGSLSSKVRYFCTEGTSAQFTASSNASAMVDGYYLISGVKVSTLPFTDVLVSSWYYDAVEFVYTENLFRGTSDTLFSPGSPMTRAMFVLVLYRLDGQPASSGSAFSDVASDSVYASAISWANANGIVEGFDDGTFRPNDSITREQMAAIMYRYARYSGASVSAGASAFEAFPDKGSVSSWARDAVTWAADKGIINGSDGYLLPAGTATRAQVAQIIKNFCENIA